MPHFCGMQSSPIRINKKDPWTMFHGSFLIKLLLGANGLEQLNNQHAAECQTHDSAQQHTGQGHHLEQGLQAGDQQDCAWSED